MRARRLPTPATPTPRSPCDLRAIRLGRAWDWAPGRGSRTWNRARGGAPSSRHEMARCARGIHQQLSAIFLEPVPIAADPAT
jgi:hypothetical protein